MNVCHLNKKAKIIIYQFSLTKHKTFQVSSVDWLSISLNSSQKRYSFH